MTSRVLILMNCLVLAVGGVASGQGSLPERQLQAAAELERDGQAAQAREIYEQIASSEDAGEWADDALLALVRMDWPVDEVGGIMGRGVDLPSLAAARENLESIRTRFPGSNSAPEACWRLALLRLVPSTPHYSPDEALALLSTLPVLYPESSRVADALVLGAESQLASGRADRAQAMSFDFLSRFPEHELRARAWLVIARSEFSGGDLEAALTALGQAQRAPAVLEASRAATDFVTLLDRLYNAAERGEALHGAPELVSSELPGKASNMAADSDGRLYVALPREDAVIVVPPGGGPVERRNVAGVQAVALDAWDRLWLAGETGVVAPGGEVFQLPEDAEIVRIAPVSPTSIWAVDDDSRSVYMLEAGGEAPVRAQLPERADPIAVVAATHGGAWILDERSGALIQVGTNGKSLKVVSLEDLAEEPLDLVRDDLGHLYLLDGDAPRILVFSPSGDLLHRLPLPSEGNASLERAGALAISRVGDIAVYESRKKRLAWLR